MTGHLKNMRILFIEDNPNDAELLKESLTKEGGKDLDLQHVLNLEQAMQNFSKQSFDIILADMNLLKTKGFSTFEAIRTIATDTAIIALTGFDDDELALKLIAAGAQDYVVKGKMDASQLIKAMRSAIKRNETVTALKNAQSRAEKQFKESNQQLANSLKELHQRTMETAILREMSDMLLACTTTDDIYALAVNAVQQLFGNNFSGGIYNLDYEQSMIRLVNTWGDFSPLQEQYPDTSCKAVVNKKMYRSNDIDTHCEHTGGTKSQSTLCIPLAANQRIFGFMYFEQPETTGEPGAGRHQETLAITIAEQISLALANVQLREDLQSQATHDPLTGLYNRRYIEEWTERELIRAARYNRQVSVAFLDIDYFKKINDTAGHHAGDDVLRQLSKMLTSMLRRTDLKGRYGGEEFIMVLPETSLLNAQNLCEKIRRQFSEIKIQTESGILENMSVSIGLSAFPEHGSTVDDLIKVADRALYRAKNEGRNRVVIEPNR